MTLSDLRRVVEDAAAVGMRSRFFTVPEKRDRKRRFNKAATPALVLALIDVCDATAKHADACSDDPMDRDLCAALRRVDPNIAL